MLLVLVTVLLFNGNQVRSKFFIAKNKIYESATVLPPERIRKYESTGELREQLQEFGEDYNDYISPDEERPEGEAINFQRLETEDNFVEEQFSGASDYHHIPRKVRSCSLMTSSLVVRC